MATGLGQYPLIRHCHGLLVFSDDRGFCPPTPETNTQSLLRGEAALAHFPLLRMPVLDLPDDSGRQLPTELKPLAEMLYKL